MDTLATPETLPDPVSIFQADLPLEAKLERARTELLDLSARNRLLNMPRSAKSARTLEVIDERTDEVFRLLVREGRPFTFLAGRSANGDDPTEADDEEIAELAQPDDALDARGVSNRHADTKLQTRLTPAGLQKRLLELYFDARTLEEEQGVNILFLALGTLKWIDPTNAANIRYAPLILVPVSLERGNAAEKFKLRWRQEEPAPNLSLEAYLDRAHGLKMPTFESNDEFDPAAYAAAVGEAVSSKAGWAVSPDDIVLGFFSFAKFLMYRDLDPEVWPKKERITEQALIRSLLVEGFSEAEDLIHEDASIDEHISPAEMLHIVDSDSSQTLAVHEVRQGRNIVIQGPPGTGKSQTIANIVASAVADGKTVLFVAEKMAALEVVKRRLDATGVGDACLELHSNKANKKAVLDELRRTWELGSPKGEGATVLNARLTEARDHLNDHVARMHRDHEAAELTPYQVIGQLTRLRQAGNRPSDIRLPQSVDWSPEDFRSRHDLLSELIERIEDIGRPADHPWQGVGLESILPTDVERFARRIADLSTRLATIQREQGETAQALETSSPESVVDFQRISTLAHRVAGAPALTGAAIASAAWAKSVTAIDDLLIGGATYARISAELADLVQPQAWTTDVLALRTTLAILPPTFSSEAFGRLSQLRLDLPKLLSDASRLSATLGREPPRTLGDLERTVAIGERVASAPDASPETFAADLWDDGVERAGDLAEAVAKLEAARAEIGSRLSDAAWTIDLAQARAVLAAHGSGLLKIFSGEWRRADKLTKSVLATPKIPLGELLPLLDALGRGQAALKEIRDGDEFGRKAFLGDWRGERSASAPMLALVAWMRSLRGLGAEPRLIVARRPDKVGIASLSARVRSLLTAARPVLEESCIELGSAAKAIWGEGLGVDTGELAEFVEKIGKLSDADKRCHEVLVTIPTALDERQRLLEKVAAGQIAMATVDAGEELGRAAFDANWQGRTSDWPTFRLAADWLAANADIRALVGRTDDRNQAAWRADAAQDAADAVLQELAGLLADLKLEPVSETSPEWLSRAPLAKLAARLTTWFEAQEDLSKWVAYCSRAERGRALGLNEWVDRLHDGRLDPADALATFEMSYYETVLADQIRIEPELGRFDGTLHGRLVREFASLDQQRLIASRLDVARTHHRGIPPNNGGAVGPLGVLRGEMARKRGHMPIRQLMQKAAPAIQALKPVFMMSPLSVAQFLPPGGLSFDLLVMDEASQIQPVDALGAVGRCRQVVVVGDPQQLPPTAFFSKMTGGTDEDADEEDGAQVADIESILGLFKARGLPERMLRWHYRSRHQSLIAVSNRQFYENKLFIVPSPYTSEAGMGLRFHHIANGIFDTGKTRTNAIEAKIVAEAIIAHALEHPELTLGVAAFSTQQKRAIQEQLELLRRGLAPAQEAFFQAHPSEPFFIKNLENVQGDERDVIFISVGYGPSTPGGKPAMRFGPLGTKGGERRLNVLISRAKRRCEVFSSISDEDIDPDFASTRKGVFAFKLFMHFARTGRMTMVESAGRDHDAVFNEQVAAALQEHGYQVHRDVGIAGLFVDLAIADPERSGRYILGVECDGPSYRSGRSARDRDRLRQAVLEDHGWIIHRLWSADWFQRPKEQLAQIIAAIEAAKVELDSRQEKATKRTRAIPFDLTIVEREDVTEIGFTGLEEGGALASTAYEEATLVRPSHCLDDLHAAPTGILTALAEQAVAVEGPVHVDEIVNRTRSAWGLMRAGNRIQDAVEKAVAVAVRQGRLRQDGHFLSIPGRLPKVRDRSQVASASLRRPEMLPPAEIQACAEAIVQANFGATLDQIVQSTSRALGFKATSIQLRGIIETVVEHAVRDRILVRQDNILVLGPGAKKEPKHSVNSAPLEALISEGEHEKLEFKQTLRWDVETNQPNKKLEDVAVKTVAAFANKHGGTLLIGVRDDGTVSGLDPDLACLGGNCDKMELHLTTLLNNYFGQAFRASKVQVSFPFIMDKQICRVDVKAASSHIIVKMSDKSGQVSEKFYVRSGNSSQELSLSQMSSYISERF